MGFSVVGTCWSEPVASLAFLKSDSWGDEDADSSRWEPGEWERSCAKKKKKRRNLIDSSLILSLLF